MTLSPIPNLSGRPISGAKGVSASCCSTMRFAHSQWLLIRSPPSWRSLNARQMIEIGLFRRPIAVLNLLHRHFGRFEVVRRGGYMVVLAAMQAFLMPNAIFLRGNQLCPGATINTGGLLLAYLDILDR